MFYVQLRGQLQDSTLECLTTYVHADDDPSQAIHDCLQHAREEYQWVFPSELTWDDVELSSVVEQDDDAWLATDDGNIFVYAERHCWDSADEAVDDDDGPETIVFPIGVVLADGDGGFDPDEIVEQYTSGNEEDFSWIEAVVDGRRFMDVLIKAMDQLGQPDLLEIRLAEHWEDGGPQIWIRRDEDPLEFVLDHYATIVENGFVEFAFQFDEHALLLRATEHRTLLATSDGPEIQWRLAQLLEELGIPEATGEFRTIEYECHHFHYRRVDGLDRDAFCQRLADEGFDEVDLEEFDDEQAGDADP